MMKRIFLTLCVIFMFFTSCAKTKKQETTTPQLSPELIKLNKVLTQMSQQCLDEMQNGNPNEFLQDLYEVLEEEKNFSSDDVSIYYLIDKKHNIGNQYEPTHLIKIEKNNDYAISRNDLSLRKEAYDALRLMAQGAKKDGITLLVSSTYRSYDYQAKLFQHWVDVDGLEEAERESARPGTSQHQLGVAVDFGSITDDFAETTMGKWIYDHSKEYGWSLSFPQGYEHITGYRWECWHFRYLGVKACNFQEKWFNNVQQFMLEFIDAWKKESDL